MQLLRVDLLVMLQLVISKKGEVIMSGGNIQDVVMRITGDNSIDEFYLADGRAFSQHLDEFESYKADYATDVKRPPNGFTPAVGNGIVDDTIAIQSMLDAGLALYFPRGEYLITDSLKLLEKSVAVGDYNSNILYDESLTKILFMPTTLKDLFVLKTPRTTSHIQGITIKGFSIKCGNGNGNAVFNMPKLYGFNGDHLMIWTGFKYGIIMDGWMMSHFKNCNWQGLTEVYIYLVKSYTNDITVSTWFEKCYFGQTAKLVLKVEEWCTNSLTFNDCQMESTKGLFDIWTENSVFVYNNYVENVPNADGVGSVAIKLGVSGGKTGANIAKFVYTGNNFQGYAGSWANALFLQADFFRTINISGVQIYHFKTLLDITANVDIVSFEDVFTTNVVNLGLSTIDWSKVKTSRCNFRLCVQDISNASEYLDTVDRVIEMNFIPKNVTLVKKKSLFMDLDERIKQKDKNSNIRRFGFLDAASSTATFSGTKLVKGEVIYNNVISKGMPVGWVSEKYSRDAQAALYDAVTTSGSPVVSSVGTFWDFKVYDYVTLSAGMPSTTVQYRIIAMNTAKTEITLDTNATGNASAVAVVLPTHSLLPFGQISYRTHAGIPTETPNFIGEEMLDTTNGKWYKSKSLTSGDWVALN